METWPSNILDVFIQLDWHSGLFFTLIPFSPVPFPVAAVHASIGSHIIPELSSGGHLGESKSNGLTVIADHVPLVSRGHECAHIVGPHLNWGFPFVVNSLIPFLILGSSTKCEFAVGSVRCSDGPLAVSLFKVLGLDWSCQDVGIAYKGIGNIGLYAPLSFVIKNGSTVIVGFTSGDLVASLICAMFDSALQMLMSFFTNKAVGKISDTLFKGLLKSQTMALIRKIGLPSAWDELAEELNKNVLTTYWNLMVGEENSKAISDASHVTDPGGFADWLGAYIDGNSESLGR